MREDEGGPGEVYTPWIGKRTRFDYNFRLNGRLTMISPSIVDREFHHHRCRLPRGRKETESVQAAERYSIPLAPSPVDAFVAALESFGAV
jgi:hypothetical protein